MSQSKLTNKISNGVILGSLMLALTPEPSPDLKQDVASPNKEISTNTEIVYNKVKNSISDKVDRSCQDVSYMLENSGIKLSENDGQVLNKLSNQNTENLKITYDTNLKTPIYDHTYKLSYDNKSNDELKLYIKDVENTVNTLAPLFNNKFINNLNISLVDNITKKENIFYNYLGLTENYPQYIYLRLEKNCVPEWVIIHELGHLYDVFITLGYPQGNSNLGPRATYGEREDFAELYTHLLTKKVSVENIKRNPILIDKIEYITESELDRDELENGNILFRKRLTLEEMKKKFYKDNTTIYTIPELESKIHEEININHINYYFGKINN